MRVIAPFIVVACAVGWPMAAAAEWQPPPDARHAG